MAGASSPSFSSFFKPNKCLSTPCPSAAQAEYCRCLVTAERKRVERCLSYKHFIVSSNVTWTKSSTTYSCIRIQHGLNPCFGLGTRTTNDLGPSELIFPCLGTLIRDTGPVVHFVECELFHQLRPSIGGRLELFDQVLAIAFVVHHLHRSVLENKKAQMCSITHT